MIRNRFLARMLMVATMIGFSATGYGKLDEPGPQPETDWVDYVNPLMGTASTPELSAGNTYPTISVPFGMNTWSPQTGKKNDGGLYTYTANYLYGIRQTRQASYWIKDYGQFSLMPVNSRNKFSEERSEEHTSELQSLMRNSYAVFCLKKQNNKK